MKLDAVGLVVKDMARSMDFYSRLGMDFGGAKPEDGHVEATLPSGLRFMMDTQDVVESFMEGWKPNVGNTSGHCFLFDSAAEVDAKYKELMEAGYEGVKEPWDAFWGQRYSTVHDPSGHSVDLFAYLPSADA